MTTINLALATKTARSTALNAAIGANASLVIYSGSQPANPDTSIGGAIALVTFPCAAVSFGAVASGVLTAGAIAQQNATASGTAAWARIWQNGGTVGIVDLDVGTASTSVILNTTTILSGGPIAIVSATITEA